MNSVKVLHPTGFNNPLILPAAPIGADKAYKYSSVAVGWAAFLLIVITRQYIKPNLNLFMTKYIFIKFRLH